MKKTIKKGQKFTAYGETYTVKSFVGYSSIEFESLKEAKEENPTDKLIGVINVECGGITVQTDCILVY